MSDVNPYAAPPDLSKDEELLRLASGINYPKDIWREGNLLIMRRDAVLPERSLKSNQPAYGPRTERRLSWTPLYINGIIFSIAGLIIILAIYFLGATGGFVAMTATCVLAPWVSTALGLHKKATIEFESSDSVRPRPHSLAFIILPLVYLESLGLLTSIFGHTKHPWDWLFCTLGVLLLISGFAAISISHARWDIFVDRIDDEHVWLKGAHPDYLDMLLEWPGA